MPTPTDPKELSSCEFNPLFIKQLYFLYVSFLSLKHVYYFRGFILYGINHTQTLQSELSYSRHLKG